MNIVSDVLLFAKCSFRFIQGHKLVLNLYLYIGLTGIATSVAGRTASCFLAFPHRRRPHPPALLFVPPQPPSSALSLKLSLLSPS